MAQAILIAAQAGRALAEAARRAGLRPYVADLFGDSDTLALSEAYRPLPGRFGSPIAAEATLAAIDALADAAGSSIGIILGSGFEDAPGLVARIAENHRLIGADSGALAALKDPFAFAALCARLGVPHPAIATDPPCDPSGWLLKRIGGSGGSHIRSATSVRVPSDVPTASMNKGSGRPQTRLPPPSAGEGGPRSGSGEGSAGSGLGAPNASSCTVALPLSRPLLTQGPPSPAEGGGSARVVSGSEFPQGANLSETRCAKSVGPAPEGHYFQIRVPGRPYALNFLADGRTIQVLACTEQWCVPSPIRPYRYGGALVTGAAEAMLLPEALIATVTEAVEKIIAATGLRGLASADFLADESGWWLTEINPRPGATLDILDRRSTPLLAAHIQASLGAMPALGAQPADAAAAQICYAEREHAPVPDFPWPDHVRDRPRPGTVVRRDAPLCTVLALGADRQAALDSLNTRTARLRADLSAKKTHPEEAL